MASPFNGFACIQHHHHVRFPNSGHSVGDDHNRLLSKHLAQRLLHDGFRFGIQGRRGFIQQD